MLNLREYFERWLMESVYRGHKAIKLTRTNEEPLKNKTRFLKESREMTKEP
jgi:hypothetical protein